MTAKTMEDLVSLCKRRGVIFPSNDIYGGMKGLYDFGPIGTELKINLKNSEFKEKLAPIERDCDCYTCKNFTLSYLYHLFSSQELLGMQLLTNHNIFFMNNLMKVIRESIRNENFEEIKKEWFNS